MVTEVSELRVFRPVILVPAESRLDLENGRIFDTIWQIGMSSMEPLGRTSSACVDRRMLLSINVHSVLELSRHSPGGLFQEDKHEVLAQMFLTSRCSAEPNLVNDPALHNSHPGILLHSTKTIHS